MKPNKHHFQDNSISVFRAETDGIERKATVEFREYALLAALLIVFIVGIISATALMLS